jgi:hypothetical protein
VLAENRMSGGVGGVTGAIPLPRPDQPLLCVLRRVEYAAFRRHSTPERGKYTKTQTVNTPLKKNFPLRGKIKIQNSKFKN